VWDNEAGLCRRWNRKLDLALSNPPGRGFGDEWWTVHDDWLLIRWLNAFAGGVTGGDACILSEALVFGAPAGVSLGHAGMERSSFVEGVLDWQALLGATSSSF
jgi:hypothetical protein